jgi:tetratricopeptide (TPR) repeat protein
MKFSMRDADTSPFASSHPSYPPRLTTEPETKQAVAENEAVPPGPGAEATETEAEAGTPPPPEPEPWTPERVSEWNAYYDRYVMGAALLLALIVACNFVTDSRLFLNLRAGQLIGERKAPLTTDEFSYTEEGQPWVNVPWLFQWSHAALYNAVFNAVPVDPLDQTANRPKADRIAIGALGLLDALVRLATAWVLLKIRHRGPGLWWSAICVTLAVGVFYDPLIGLAPGGLASVPGFGSATTGIMPSSWGQLFLALELLIAFRAFDQGRPRYLWWLIPLFVLWANWDVSFLTGLVLLAAIVVGHWLDGGALTWPEQGADDVVLDGKKLEGVEPIEATTARPVPISTALLVLGLCTAASLVNPSTYRAFAVALNPFVQLIWPSESYQFIDTLSFFTRGVPKLVQAFYLTMVAAGVASFILNAARFSWRRFVPFAVISLLWGCLMRYSVEFALVFATVIALNGQEWYLSRFGGAGRLGRGWTLWSTGGRVVTLLLIFAAVGLDITGYHIYKKNVHFGLGYNPNTYPIEAAEFLERHNEIRGNVFNTLAVQGDLLIWKAFPKRKTYFDSRTSQFSRARMEEREHLRKAIRDEDIATWKPLLDRYNVTVVMIDPSDSFNTYNRLMEGLNWIPFYDDGRVAMFGRKDAPASEVAFFNANRLEPDRAYRVSNPVPPVSGPPTPTSWMDLVFQNRNLERKQMRTLAAERWLRGGPSGAGGTLPDPARCLLAIQDARIALSRDPDDTSAFRVLFDAYRCLAIQESALLAGIPLTPESKQRILATAPAPDRLMNRFRQQVAALNFAIQTTPPPESEEARVDLFNLNLQLFELYMPANFLDLARDRLKAAMALNPPETRLAPEARLAMQNQLNQLEEAVQQIAQKIDEVDIEQQPRAVDLAMFARQQGAIGMAIDKLARADESGDSPAIVKPLLLELYCLTGQPDKASEMLNVGAIGDPNLGTEPGMATYRQGLVFELIGNYRSAAGLFDRSLLQLRMSRSGKAMMAARSLIRGEDMLATNEFLGIPTSLEQQASWELDLAMCLLEGGEPAEAADHFTKALTLEPNLTLRPIAAYYLEKLGKPVPPRREVPGAKKTTPADAKAAGPGPSPAAVPALPAPPRRDASSPPDAKAKAAAQPEPARVPPAGKPGTDKAPAKKPEEGKAAPG